VFLTRLLQIQQLNHRITIRLNSEARSEVEGVRWLVTRRAATALAISALMILATLRYSSYQQHLAQEQLKAQQSPPPPDGKDGSPGNPNGGNGTTNGTGGDSGDPGVAGEGLIVSEGGVHLG
jgi:hypothetical protein